MKNSTHDRRAFPRRQIISLVLSGMGVLLSPQAYALDPSVKTIRVIVGQSPGGAVDQTARAFADHLTRVTKISAVVENKPGGLGMIAANEVARAPANGATLMIVLNSNMAQAPVLLDKPPVNPDEDFVPIASFSIGQPVVAVSRNLPIKSANDLMEYARKHPVSAGNFGIGTNWQMLIQHLNSTQKTQFTLINYKGGAPMQNDLMAGTIDLASGSQVSLGPAIRDGRVTPIAVPGLRRSKLLPDVPTWSEQGFKDEVFGETAESAMLLGPKGLPAPVVEELARIAAASFTESPTMRTVATALDADPPKTGPALAAHISRTWGFYRRLTKELGVKVQ